MYLFIYILLSIILTIIMIVLGYWKIYAIGLIFSWITVEVLGEKSISSLEDSFLLMLKLLSWFTVLLGIIDIIYRTYNKVKKG